MALTVSGKVNAGFAAVDITPKMGAHLAGSGAGLHRPAQTVLDRLYARAAVFKNQETTLCVLELDVTLISSEYAERIASGVMKALDVPRECVMVMGTQTHSAPMLGYCSIDEDFPLDIPADREYIKGGEREYSDFAAEQAIKAATEAAAKMRPLRMQFARGMKRDLAFNRRVISRITTGADGDDALSYKNGLTLEKGKITMPFPVDNMALRNPAGPDYISHVEGPIDDEVVVGCFIDEHMQIESLLLNFTCHPVNAFCNDSTFYAVSADWCGAWAGLAKETLNAKTLPLVINGCCGNTNPIDPYKPDMVLSPKEMGEKLAELTGTMVHRMRFDGGEDVKLSASLAWLPLDYRTISKERKKEVEDILGEHPECPKYQASGELDADWFVAASTRSVELMQKREPKFMYPVQVFRIGDLAIVALAGEPFSEGQLDLKLRSPAALTVVGHMANKYVGYIPIAAGCERGGLEAHPKVTYWSKLAPDSLEKIVDKSLELLQKLYRD